jgi:CubicO group peptidase (beta-lactamase class C family)
MFARSKHPWMYLYLMSFAGLLCCLCASALWSQAPSPTAASPKAVAQSHDAAATAKPVNELTAGDLEAFLDGLMPAQLEREDIAGVVVAVVKGGKVVLEKGYGFADVAKRRPVSAEDTLFRPGSTSKLFTWTSVMQQVEKGKLELDRDVNDYLDFKIPPAFGKPITLRNIMTHTSGFEESGKELFVPDAAHIRPLGEYLRTHIPARIFPPGTTPAYSNYATAIAGYIVERVSGKPFEQYVADNIFKPLGMNRTTFVQPLPETLQPLMSSGYLRASQDAKPFEFVQGFPAGSVSTTAADMCRFMEAQLDDGRFGSVKILRPETAKLMHSRQFAADPRLNGMALGFYEESRNGRRIIGHGGDTVYFHSDLHLILDANVGFFVSYNSLGKLEVSARSILFDAFLDRYFPYTPPPAQAVATAKQDAQHVSGLYLSSRRFETSFLRVASFVGQAKVFSNTDGTISVDPLKGPNGEFKRFEEIAPLLYRERNGQDHLGFQRDAQGSMLLAIDYPFFVFPRAHTADNKYFNYAVLIPSVVVILLTLLLWPVAAGVRWHYGRKLEFTGGLKRLRLVSRLVAALFVIVLLGWVVVLSKASNPTAFGKGLDPLLIVIQLLGVIAALGTLAVILYAARSWTQSGLWLWTKLHAVALAAACMGMTWFLWHWNLMNFNLHY